jgi:hypothetical protein
MTTTPSANDLTRQQLEELDALLQRMLALPTPTTEPKPVAMPAELPLPPVGESWRVDRPTPAAPKQPYVAAPLTVPSFASPEEAAADEVDLTAMPEPIDVTRHEAPVTSKYLLPPDPPEPAEPTPPTVSNDAMFATPTVPVTPSLPYCPPAEVPLVAAVEMPQFGRIKLDEINVNPLPMPSNDPEPTTTVEPPAEAAATAGVPVLAWPVYAVNWVAEECLKVFGGESLTHPSAKWAMGLAGMVMMAAAGVWTAHGYGVVTLPIK